MIDCNSLPSANGRERRVVEVGKRHSELMERVDKEFLRENTSYLDTSERTVVPSLVIVKERVGRTLSKIVRTSRS